MFWLLCLAFLLTASIVTGGLLFGIGAAALIGLSSGFLMGFGAMLVPGGNAKLILHDLPDLSVHALIAYLAMVLGILLTLLVQKRASGHIDSFTKLMADVRACSLCRGELVPELRRRVRSLLA